MQLSCGCATAALQPQLLISHRQPRPRRRRQAFTFLLGPPSTRGCSTLRTGSVFALAQRLLLSCMCPPRCVGRSGMMFAPGRTHARQEQACQAGLRMMFDPILLASLSDWACRTLQCGRRRCEDSQCLFASSRSVQLAARAWKSGLPRWTT